MKGRYGICLLTLITFLQLMMMASLPVPDTADELKINTGSDFLPEKNSSNGRGKGRDHSISSSNYRKDSTVWVVINLCVVAQ